MGKRVSNKDVSSSRAYNNRKLEQRQGPSTGNTGSRSRGSRHRRGHGERPAAGGDSARPVGRGARVRSARNTHVRAHARPHEKTTKSLFTTIHGW